MNAKLQHFEPEFVNEVAYFPRGHTQIERGGPHVNCLPSPGLENKVQEMGGFSMTIYDRSVREAACGLFERGLGHEAAAARLGVPLKAVRQ